MRQRSVFLWAVLVPALALAGCSGGEVEPAGDPVTSVTYTVRGMLARIEDDGMTMTVRHEDIPDYMVSMTMPFKVQEAALLEGLEYGDKIQFELVVDAKGSVVTSISELPPETVLSFETPGP